MPLPKLLLLSPLPILLATIASAQIPVDFFTGVEFDEPLPVKFTTGEVELVSGTVTNPTLLGIILLFESPERPVEHRIRLVRGRFEHPILFTHDEAGAYTVQVIFLSLAVPPIESRISDTVEVVLGGREEIELPPEYYANWLDPARFIPNAVAASEDVLPPLYIRTGGSPTAVFVRIRDASGREVEREFQDDGLNGDRVAGDGIYTVAGAPFIPSVLRNGDFDSVRAFVVVQYRGGILPFTAECGVVDGVLSVPEPIETGVSRSDYVLGLVDMGILVSHSTPGVDMVRASRRFYEHFGDDYDFLVVRSALPLALGVHGVNFKVKNEVRGIGMDLLDDTDEFGSAGRLQGITFINFRHFGPLVHEIAHNWANFLDIFDGDLFRGHWGFTNVRGVLGGYATSFARVGTDRYAVPGDALNSFWGGRYSALELYLMGLVPAADVPPHQVLRRSRIVGSDEETNELVVSGSLETVTIGAIVESEGRRIPGFEESQKSFRMGTIVVSDAPLTRAQLTYYDRQVAFFGSQVDDPLAFAAATGFRATMDTRLDRPITAILDADSTASGGLHPSLSLSQNYPNPFNSTTIWRFDLDRTADVRLEIFALNGQRVRTIELDGRGPGEHSIAWDGRDASGHAVASGNYVAVMRVGAFATSRKLALIR